MDPDVKDPFYLGLGNLPPLHPRPPPMDKIALEPQLVIDFPCSLAKPWTPSPRILHLAKYLHAKELIIFPAPSD
jgi:hypothetical protein